MEQLMEQRRRSSSGSLGKRVVSDRDVDDRRLSVSRSPGRLDNEVNEVKISGISYQARQSDIVEFCEMVCEVRCIRVKMLMDRVNPNRHRGVAFVELEARDAVEKCISKSGSEHMGRWLQIQKAFGRPQNKEFTGTNYAQPPVTNQYMSNNSSNTQNYTGPSQSGQFNSYRQDREYESYKRERQVTYRPSRESSPHRRRYSPSGSPQRNVHYHPSYMPPTEERFPSRPTDSGRTVFVGNLDYSIEQKELERVFEECGMISTIRMGVKNGRPQGFAHIEYDNPRAVSRAMKKNGMEIRGRTIRVDTCNQRRNNMASGGGGGSQQRYDRQDRFERQPYPQRRERSRSRSFQRRYRRSRSRSNDSFRMNNNNNNASYMPYRSRSSSRQPDPYGYGYRQGMGGMPSQQHQFGKRRYQ